MGSTKFLYDRFLSFLVSRYESCKEIIASSCNLEWEPFKSLKGFVTAIENVFFTPIGVMFFHPPLELKPQLFGSNAECFRYAVNFCSF